jgi:hypothetical protein
MRVAKRIKGKSTDVIYNPIGWGHKTTIYYRAKDGHFYSLDGVMMREPFPTGQTFCKATPK